MSVLSEPSRTAAPPRRSWCWLIRVAALVLAANAVLTQVAGRFIGPSMVVLAVLCLVAAGLVHRRPRSVAAGLAAICVLNIVLHGFVLAILTQGLDLGLMYVLASVDLVATVVVLVAAVPVLRGRDRPGILPRRVVGVAVTAVVLATAATSGFYLTRTDVDPRPGEPVLVHTGTEVEPRTLVVGGSGSLVLRNEDPVYPRSFDVDALDVHVVVPPLTSRRIELPPGEHEFYDYVTFTEATSGIVVVE